MGIPRAFTSHPESLKSCSYQFKGLSLKYKNTIHLITDGTIKYDGGSFFGQIPKMYWEKHIKSDRFNRVNVGLNCLVIKTENGNVLIDTGAGTKDRAVMKEKYGVSRSKLLSGLKEVGLSAKDIDFVLLTQLQSDHSGGCSKIDRSGQPIPVFPKAKYIVQESAWDYATNPGIRSKDYYNSRDFNCLKDFGQLVFVSGSDEILPGITVKKTDGYCIGHQIIQIESGGEKIVLTGDIIPTSLHIDPTCISAYDQCPEDTFQEKTDLIRRAIKEGFLLIFSHANNQKAGYLEERNGSVLLKPVNL